MRMKVVSDPNLIKRREYESSNSTQKSIFGNSWNSSVFVVTCNIKLEIDSTFYCFDKLLRRPKNYHTIITSKF